MRIATTISFLAAIAAVVVDAAPNNLAVTVSCQKQYIVQANDKCYKIAAAYNIYASQLLKWNPQVNSGCTNLYIGETLCLSAPSSAASLVATKVVTTTTTKKSTTTTKTTAKTTGKTSTKTTSTKTTAKTTSTKTTSVPKTTVIVPTGAQCQSDNDCPGITCCNLFNNQCVLDPNNNICDIKPTTKVTTMISGSKTVTKVTTTLSSTKATPTPTYYSGVTVSLDSASSFCLLLPPSPGNKDNNGGKTDLSAISDSEGYAVSFCTIPNINAPGARGMPSGFITKVNYQTNSTAGFIQVTGSINPAAWGLSTSDQGGQYDNHGQGNPANSACKGFPYYVQLIEPNISDFCIRCCMSKEDCNTSRSAYGCKRVVPVLSKSV